MSLPININDLLRGKPVEWERLELKAGWNPKEVLHTLCAFANDIHNLGGGYIIIGVEENNGRPVLPPVGLDVAQIDSIQKELLNLGYSAIAPYYHPLAVPVEIDGRHVLVLWALGGPTRPYKAKRSLAKDAKDYEYYIRKGSSTVRARGADESELMSLSYPGPDRSVRLDQLRIGRAHPRRYRNRRLGEYLKELEFTEGRSTGIPKIMEAMVKNGSPPAEFEFDEDHSYFMVRLPAHPAAVEVTASTAGAGKAVFAPPVTPPVTPPVEKLLAALSSGESLGGTEIRALLGLKDRTHVRQYYIEPALSAGLIEYTIPDKPNSRLQKYRLTEKGRQIIEPKSIK